MFRRTLLAAAMLLGATSFANATVLFTDNFNTETQALNGSLSNWTVTNGTIDVIGAPAFFDFYPGNGNYLDMDGSSSDAGKITTNSSFNLIAGQQYAISFDFGKNGLKKESLNVKVGAFSWVLSLGATLTQGNILTGIAYLFTPTANVSGAKISFEGVGTDNQGVIIDNVQLSAVPIPAAAPLLVMGLMGLGALARRRKAAAKV
jgi:hypothetical protein